MVHAAGGAIPAGIPCVAAEALAARAVPQAGARGPGHVAADRAPGRRRRDPVRRHPAAVRAAGPGLTFSAGEGPQITRPVREAGQVLELPPVDPATDLAYVLEAARLAARALPPHVPLIGFAGAPFTLASYAIEGGATRSFALTKRFMYSEPRAWH